MVRIMEACVENWPLTNVLVCVEKQLDVKILVAAEMSNEGPWISSVFIRPLKNISKIFSEETWS
jgi:hypothetical protein